MSQVESQIIEVTVYSDRARVRRRGNVSLETGIQHFEISGLPLTLDLDSVRASARGTAKARLLSLQVERTFFVDTPSEQIHQLEEQIEALQDEKQALEAQAQLVKQTRADLSAVAAQARTFARALASGKTSLEAQISLFDTLRSHIAEQDQALLDLAIRRRGIDRHLDKLNKELENWRGAPQKEAFTAIIEIEVLNRGDLAVDLTYFVSGASWQPLYDLRLVEGDAKASLEVAYMAQVIQRTAELWQEVTMTLSTARPALADRIPELDPWYVRPFTPPVPLPRAKALYDRAESRAQPEFMMAAAPLAEEAAMPVEASVEATGAAITYRVPGTVTVPEDGTPHKVTITGFKLEPNLDYVVTPKLVEAAYRRAKVSNTSPYLLMPGAANLFAGDEFIGMIQLELTPPQGEIELYLGVDDRLKVERELKRRDIDKKLIGGKRRYHYAYEITVVNLLPIAVEITLHDQIPISRHEDVKIKLESANPQPSEQTELYLLTWAFGLAPQEKHIIRFDFSIETPQGMELVGLP